MRLWPCVLLLCALTTSCWAQEKSDDAFSRKNTWAVFAEYSNTSSHILMGSARQRMLADFGGAYTRRVVRFKGTTLSYQIEVRPVLFESDPLTIDSYTVALTYPGQPAQTSAGMASSVNNRKCAPYSAVSIFTPPPGDPTDPTETIAQNFTCGRQWTFGQQFAPIGFKYSLRTHHRLQPFVIGTLGYMYTSRPVPLANAEAFNFVWDFGTGLELYRSGKRSVSVEARIHHFSNRDTAPANPGTDNITYKVSYSFGR
jgi:hypothetical protein